jgi:hypothetical protein
MSKILYIAALILLLSCGESEASKEELESSYNQAVCVKELNRYEYMGEVYESESWSVKLEGVSPGELEVLWLCYENAAGSFTCEEPLLISYSLESDSTVIICDTTSGVYNDSFSSSHEGLEIRDKSRYVLFWKSI